MTTKTMSKRQLRAWLSRIREDLRDVETLVGTRGPLDEADLRQIEILMQDASGAAAQVITDLRGEYQ